MMITFLEDNSFCQNVNLLMFVLKTNRENIFLANWDEMEVVKKMLLILEARIGKLL